MKNRLRGIELFQMKDMSDMYAILCDIYI